MHLFLGAITAFKNPSSQRGVENEDPVEAADLVHLADLLLRIIDRERPEWSPTVSGRTLAS